MDGMPVDMSSILTSVKKMVGDDMDSDYFDPEIIMDINLAFMTLTQIGIGPSTGFFISDVNNSWSEFLDDRTDLEAVKNLVYLKTKLIFDPPSSAFVLDAMERGIAEITWRLSIKAEEAEEVAVVE